MSHQQHTLMRFDPATGAEKPYPSHAAQWRDWHGQSTAWLFNPWTGERRHAGDVGTDLVGYLIIPPGEPIYADTSHAAQKVLALLGVESYTGALVRVEQLLSQAQQLKELYAALDVSHQGDAVGVIEALRRRSRLEGRWTRSKMGQDMIEVLVEHLTRERRKNHFPPDTLSERAAWEKDIREELTAWVGFNAARIANSDEPLMMEDITLAVEQSGLVRTSSCCGVPHKFCKTDVWQGNLEAFAKQVLRNCGAVSPSSPQG